MKKQLIFILSLIIMIGMVAPASAKGLIEPTGNSASILLDAGSKIDFAKQMDARFARELQQGMVRRGTIEEIDALLIKAAFATDTERQSINRQLSSLGVYEYVPARNPRNAIVPFSGSGDVSVDQPLVYYETWENTWTISFAGTWNNDNWREQILLGNVGGEDGYGVGFTNTGTYKSSVIRSFCYIADQNGGNTVSTVNRSDGDGSKGFGFRLQDYTKREQNGSVSYSGYKWFGYTTYDNWFGNYSGVATAYYIHTWNSTSITGVTFGYDGKSAGINVTFSTDSNRFIGFSSDKTFGVYP